jgi:broad specificity phosphatase PhoE
MFDDDYDKLSLLGQEQSRRLGGYWRARGVTFDEIYSGPQKRQLHTAEIVAESFAGIDWPQTTVIDGLREYNGDGIIEELLPLAIERDERIRKLADEYRQSGNGPERLRRFQRMFEPVVMLWVRGEISSSGVESWRSFHDRVRGALEQLTAGEGSGRRIAVFTSGGPTAVAVQMATRAPEQMAMELNWRIRNCSLTEIVFSRDRFTLDVFNSLGHLDDPRMWTYR